VFYLVALTVHSMTGWDVYLVTIIMGVVTVFYTYLGGLEAVIWTDVVQVSSVSSASSFAWGSCCSCARRPGAAFQLAWENGKFSLGILDFDLAKKGFWVMTFYGVFWYLQKYGADQTVVQRYLVTKSDSQAIKGATLGALFVRTGLDPLHAHRDAALSFYRLTGETFPAHISKADQIFPWFLSTHISTDWRFVHGLPVCRRHVHPGLRT